MIAIRSWFQAPLSVSRGQYRIVPNGDSDIRSNTNSDPGSSTRSIPAVSKTRWIAWAVAFVTSTALALVFFPYLILGSNMQSSQTLLTKVPLSAEPVTFRPDPPGTYQIWEDIVRPGFANFAVRHPSRFSLGPGVTLPGEDDIEMYSLSMFHQLHCLGIIRASYYAKSGMNVSSMPVHTHHLSPMDHEKHIVHCFDYLRQGILCSADTTIEGARVEADDRSRVQTDGWGIQHHECKDVSKVMDFVEKYRYFSKTGEIVFNYEASL